MALFDIIVTIFGVLMSVANLPQAYIIFKKKSAKDISPITYSILSIGSLVWFIYGIHKESIPIIVSYGPGFMFTTLVVIGWFKYGNKEEK